MSMQKIHFRIFGTCKYFSQESNSWESLEQSAGKSIGKKQRAFLVYLLLNANREISANELMDHFWGEDGKDPANSLKNMIFKIRSLLQALFPDRKDLLITKNNGYRWNSEVEVVTDALRFEELYEKAAKAGTEESLDMRMEAVSLYTGVILPGISYEWLDNLNTYYRTVYIDLCRVLVQQMTACEDWKNVIKICKSGYDLAPEVEEFTLHSMNAMIAIGLHSQAIALYENYQAMLWHEFGLAPSEAVEQSYRIASQFNGNTGEYVDEFFHQMNQPVENSCAFQCSMITFQNIVQLERRHMMRSHHSSTMVAIWARGKDNAEPSSTDLRRLGRILTHGLRGGDPFTHLNKGGYILMLAGADLSNSQKVVERIQKNFYSTFSQTRAVLEYRIFPLRTEE